MSNTVTGAQDVAAAQEQGISSVQSRGWSKQDTTWVISLFGTAVGAGILFLPINAGMGGFWPLVVMALLVGPMTYLAHRGLARFVLSSKQPNADITQVVEEHFGVGAGKLITLLYFFAIYPIVLIYGVGITNTVESFLVNQLQMTPPPRWVLSIVLIMAMMSVMLAGEKLMLKVTEFLVYPLIAILAGISSFALAQRRDHGEHAVAKSDAILKRTAIILLGFVMFFVFSCVMSLTPAQLAEAKSQNIAVLSYLANQHASPIISYFGPLVAFVAIVSSFFGHYLGAREGLKGMIVQNMRSSGKAPNQKKVELFIIAFFILTLWGVAVINPSILGMIESLGGPIIATILFLMPMYAIKRVPAMAKYQGQISNVFVATMGLIAISAILYQLVG
ncbi:aromatic amino acid transport family protein [Aeromonas caviae]